MYIAQSFFVRVPVIGKYALEPLGGAPPEVIAARAFIGEARADGRLFVLKLANPIYNSNIAHLHNEAAALSRLRHPAVVGLHDQGDWPVEFLSGETRISPFIVIDCCTTDLELALTNAEEEFHGMPGISVLADVASAVAYIHSQGIVHADVRPDNVLLVEAASGWRAKLADFGLAVTSDEQRHAWRSTPLLNEYTPPDREVSSRYDVYSLGALAFKLFCDGSFFRRQFCLEKEFAWRRSVPPEARPDLAKLIEAATVPDEANRDISAAEMLSVLEEIMART
jgi:serine/threonine protein kinase